MKNFVGFVVSLLNSIAANSEWRVFQQVAEDIYTEYAVQEGWSYHSEVVIPSYVGAMGYEVNCRCVWSSPRRPKRQEFKSKACFLHQTPNSPSKNKLHTAAANMQSNPIQSNP